MNFFAQSDRGLIRSENQDSYDSFFLEADIFISTVCDGMGGHANGGIASKTAVTEFNDILTCEYYKGTDQKAPSIFDIRRMMKKALNSANKAVYSKSITDPECDGMGTTLVSAFIIGNSLYTVNVGDSRAYLLHNGRLRLLTKDHSVIMREGKKNYGALTRSVGTGAYVDGDYTMTELSEGDKILLCSDGLWGEIGDTEIKKAMSSASLPEMISAELVCKANDNGGSDNITAVVIAF